MKAIKLAKWMAAAVVLMVATSSMVFAQQGERRGGGAGGMNPKEMAQRTTDRLAERLKLTKEQKDQVFQLQLDQSEAMQKAFSGGNQDREAMRATMTKTREQFETKLLNLLDENQKAEYKKMQEEGARRGEGRIERGGGRQR